MACKKTSVRVGLIEACLFEDEGGSKIIGPMTFDDVIVREDGQWEILGGECIEDALTRIYLAEFAGWCERREKERMENAIPVQRMRRILNSNGHFPCPVLWAGR